MKDYNAEFMRDISREQTTVQRPGNRAFWENPEVGRAEWALNKLLADLTTGAIKIDKHIPPLAG